MNYTKERKTIQEWLDLLVDRNLADEIFSDIRKTNRENTLSHVVPGIALISSAFSWSDLGKIRYYSDLSKKLNTNPETFYVGNNELSYELY